MLRRIRIAFLLYVLLFVALGQFLDAYRSTDWDDTLWVGVYAVNPDGSAAADAFIDGLGADAYSAVERFFEREAAGYRLPLDRPFRIRLTGQIDRPLPPLPAAGNVLGTIAWSLRMRWLTFWLHREDDAPTPDITVFAVYHADDAALGLDRSTALRKGMIAVANLYAERSQQGSNEMVLAHELLHTLGASDKYDRASNLPLYPDGYADPGRAPRLPQPSAELMAGRIPVSATHAETPRSLGQVVIGPVTAREIGWQADQSPALAARK